MLGTLEELFGFCAVGPVGREGGGLVGDGGPPLFGVIRVPPVGVDPDYLQRFSEPNPYSPGGPVFGDGLFRFIGRPAPGNPGIGIGIGDPIKTKPVEPLPWFPGDGPPISTRTGTYEVF